MKRATHDYRAGGIPHADYLRAAVEGPPGETLLRAAGRVARFAREHTLAWEAHRTARIALETLRGDALLRPEWFNIERRRAERTARMGLARARVNLDAARNALRLRVSRIAEHNGVSTPESRATIVARTLALREGRGVPRPAATHGHPTVPEHTRGGKTHARGFLRRVAREYRHAETQAIKAARVDVPRYRGAGNAQHLASRLGGAMIAPAHMAQAQAKPRTTLRAQVMRGVPCARKGSSAPIVHKAIR